jgi:PAS domain-containing protein
MLLIEPHTGIIVDANTAAAEFYGYSKEELSVVISGISTPLLLKKLNRKGKEPWKSIKTYFIFRHRLANGNPMG